MGPDPVANTATSMAPYRAVDILISKVLSKKKLEHSGAGHLNLKFESEQLQSVATASVAAACVLAYTEATLLIEPPNGTRPPLRGAG